MNTVIFYNKFEKVVLSIDDQGIYTWTKNYAYACEFNSLEHAQKHVDTHLLSYHTDVLEMSDDISTQIAKAELLGLYFEAPYLDSKFQSSNYVLPSYVKPNIQYSVAEVANIFDCTESSIRCYSCIFPGRLPQKVYPGSSRKRNYYKPEHVLALFRKRFYQPKVNKEELNKQYLNWIQSLV